MTSVSVDKIGDFPAISTLEEVILFFSPGASTIYDFPSAKGSIVTQYPLYLLNHHDDLKTQSQ